MAYVGYDYGLGSGSAQNPNPFVYGSGSGYGYDAPFNPQLDHLTGGAVETRYGFLSSQRFRKPSHTFAHQYVCVQSFLLSGEGGKPEKEALKSYNG